MSAKSLKALSLALIVSGCATGSRQMPDEIDRLMERYASGEPGISLLVVQDGVPVVRRSRGLADLENKVAATSETNYRLASVTKQFTAAAILLLIQDVKLSLDDPIGKFLTSLPQSVRGIAIRHLLTHTSGVIDYEQVMPRGTTAQLHDPDVLRLLESHDSTYFAPGFSYRYSNSGYSLLALVVERVAGITFAAFLRDRIFAPLGMTRTVAFEDGISTVEDRAFGYRKVNGSWMRRDQSTTSAVLGDGGIYSSIDDLAKWDAALYDSRLLNEESRRLAFAPHTPTDDPTIQYGFGWRITGETLWHSGETTGFRNVIVRFPAKKTTVIVLSNREDFQVRELALSVAKSVFAH